MASWLDVIFQYQWLVVGAGHQSKTFYMHYEIALVLNRFGCDFLQGVIIRPFSR